MTSERYNRQDDERRILNELRKQIFMVGYEGGMAHLASCYSCLEILYTLYIRHILHYDSKDRKDRLILSKGHAGLALYAILCRAGLMAEEELHTYLRPGCHIGGEPCTRDLKAVEASTGSLGHGLGIGVGMALAQKIDGSKARTFVILGDGECEEGSIWEAAMAASALQLGNLTAILDCNEIQKMDSITNTIGMNNWEAKWHSFGWTVLHADGHNTDELAERLINKGTIISPRLVIAHTIKGKGVSIMEGKPNWHFKLPNKKELQIFKEELAITDAEMEAVCKGRI